MILPAIEALTGIGLIMMIVVRDPMRDTQAFVNFSLGVAGGAVLMLVLSFVDCERLFVIDHVKT